jgi:murein DD-endopeptidase MepM/ murein hydrolase activator NlpD
MQIILLHPRFTAKSITLGSRHIVLLLSLFLCAAMLFATLMFYFIERPADNSLSLFSQRTTALGTLGDEDQKDKFIRENLAAMAIRLGEMQAQLMRLDALGERVQGLAGVKPEEFNFREKPGRGGAEYLSAGDRKPHYLSMPEFKTALEMLAADLELRSDYFNVVETTLMNDKLRIKLLPTIQPVNVSYNASGFGWRLDPFSGRNSFHGGLDFSSPAGTPILAAAAGVVIAAEYHSEFGNMLEIDHGNEIVTRYGHASKLLVRPGDIVKRGQHVANIGSTGRSTGSHLHFEVLVKNIAQDPQKFLVAGAGHSKQLPGTKK